MNRSTRGSLLRGLAVALICVAVLLQHSNAADIDVLVDIIRATNIALPSWKEADKANYCTWENVFCDAAGRVTHLYMQGQKGAPIMQGRLPDSITQLTALIDFRVDSNNLIGDFPQEMFMLPNITWLWLGNTGMIIRFPPMLSPSINRISVERCHVVGPLPDSTNWHQFVDIILTDTNVKCPLPAGLVHALNTNNTKMMDRCRFDNTLMTIQDNMLCGQIPLGGTTCDVLPRYTGPYFPTDDRPADVLHRIELDKMTMEFVDNEIYFFGVYRDANESYGMGPDRTDWTFTFNHSKWETFAWETPTLLRVNATRVEDVVVQLIFEFNRTKTGSATDFAPVKFSYAVYNFGHVWKSMVVDPNELLVSLNYQLNYRFVHSPQFGEPIKCNILSTVIDKCSSSVGSVTDSLDLKSGDHVLSALTNTIEMLFSYPLAGELDGRPLGDQNTLAVFVSAAFLPLPFPNWMDINLKQGNTLPDFGALLANESQTFSVAVQMDVPRIQRYMIYDPDVSVRLLFGSDELPPSDSDIDKQTQTIIVVVVSVIAVIVIIVGATVFVKVVFPYWNRSIAETQLMDDHDLTPLESESPERSTVSGWKAASVPTQ